MRRRWAELEADRAEAVWRSARPAFLSQVVGPHFETLCREFAISTDVFGELPAEVGYGIVTDSASRGQIEVDVIVLAAPEPGRPRRILSLGEAKWGKVMDPRHAERLARARDLLAVKGFDTRQTILACYSGGGFTDDLRRKAADEPLLLVTPRQMYE